MKKFTLLLGFILIFSCIYSQNTDYKTYQQNGKLYFNKNMPIYFWVSTSPDDNSNDILLQSEATKKYANPMYFDTEGYNTLQTNTAKLEGSKKLNHVIFKVYADDFAPSVSAQFFGRRKYIAGKFIYRKGLKVQLNGDDSMSGLASIFYSINNSEFYEYKSNIEFKTPDKYILQFYGVDNTGNKSRIHTYRFSIE